MSGGDVTVGFLKRLSYLPDREGDITKEQGNLIAGQDYWDVDFIGGSIANVILTDVEINGVSTARNERTVIESPVTVEASDYILLINQTIAAPISIPLPSPTISRSLIIKDAKGDAAINNITVDGNGALIDGDSEYVINQNSGSVEIISDGVNWSVINNYISISDEIEGAQDAVGSIFDATLTYNDSAPSMGRAAISGDITIPAGSNTASITALSIVDGDISATAAINAAKIGNGTINNAEFQTLNGVTSNIQTQLDGKQPDIQFQDEGVNLGSSGDVTSVNFVGSGITASIIGGALTVTATGGSGGGDVSGPASSTDNAIARFDMLTGKILQNSNAILDDTGNLSLAGTVSATNVSGTNTGDQTITLTGAVTGSGTGSFSTAFGSAEITGLSTLSANGSVTRTGAGTYASRTMTGTTNLITVTNGDGVAGNPTFTVGSLVAQTTATQTLTNKTLTNPTINAATISGTFAGAATFSGAVTFNNATSPIIAAKIGPSSTQQHTFPAVTSDTVALLGASQTLTGKTIDYTANTPIGFATAAQGSLASTALQPGQAIKLNSSSVIAATGTSIDINSIPSNTKKIEIIFIGVSTNGTDNPLIQLGDSGGIENTGYLGSGSNAGGSNNDTTGFRIRSGVAANTLHGIITLLLADPGTNLWVCSGALANSSAPETFITAGSKPLSATLDRIRLTTTGASSYDAGSLVINWWTQ